MAWLPSVILGVLFLAWLASLWATINIAVPCQRGGYLFWFVSGGSCGVYWMWPLDPTAVDLQIGDTWPRMSDLTGRFHLQSRKVGFPDANYVIPIPWLMAVVLPLAVGVRTRFRFSLRMWLAWLALAAFLLAMTTYRSYTPWLGRDW